MNGLQKFSLLIAGDSELLPLLLGSILLVLIILIISHFLPAGKKERPKSSSPIPSSLRSVFPASRRYRHLKRNDYTALAVLMSVYALFSFHQLGSSSFPSTTWQPTSDEQKFVLELTEDTAFDAIYVIYNEGDNNSNPDQWQLGIHDLRIYGSNDDHNWELVTTIDGDGIYKYIIQTGDWNYRYVRFNFSNKNDSLTEVGFRASGGDTFLPVTVYRDEGSDTAFPASLVIDEQDQLAVDPTYYDEAYFDEVYHPRNAAEIASGEYMYATVHPLLGTCMIALSIRIFGINPLAWRLPGAIAGVLMIPVFYLLVKMLFRKSEYAIFGTFLFATEFMHFTTSRIATLEPFSILTIMLMFLFMVIWFYTYAWDTPAKKRYLLLMASGISFGIAGATKWTAFYSAVGLAILFFTHYIYEFCKYRKARKMLAGTDLTETEAAFLQRFTAAYPKQAAFTILWNILFFIIVPVIIYFAVYIPCKVWRDGWSIANVIDQIKYIYNYHIDLQATHPYSSTWHQWLLDIRPIWYYYGKDAAGTSHSISCFTNPLLTWVGFLTTIYTIVCLIVYRSREAFIILVGYLTALLPWVLVTRCVFAYHFYPTSIFMLLSIVFTWHDLLKDHPKLCFTAWILMGLSLLFFLYFLPVISGFGTTVEYIKGTEWLSTWYFG